MKYWFGPVLLWLVLMNMTQLCTSLPRFHKFMKRVIGGEATIPDKYPWAVSLKGNIHTFHSTLVCGATFISDRWLLTAAHCFNNIWFDLRDPALWHLTAGYVQVQHHYMRAASKSQLTLPIPGPPTDFHSSDSNNSQSTVPDDQNVFNETYRIERIILHENYSMYHLNHDIALIQLDKPVPLDAFPGVASVNLPSTRTNLAKYPRPGKHCVIVGWGCTVAQGSPNSQGQYTEVEVMSYAKCRQAYHPLKEFSLDDDHEFCAGFVNKQIGMCQGDSGSGLVCRKAQNNWTIAGVLSSGHPSVSGNQPDIFTRVSVFNDWIHSTMKKY